MYPSEDLPPHIPSLDADHDPVLKAAEKILKASIPTKPAVKKKSAKGHNKKSKDRVLPEGWARSTKERASGPQKGSPIKGWVAPDGTFFDRWSAIQVYLKSG